MDIFRSLNAPAVGRLAEIDSQQVRVIVPLAFELTPGSGTFLYQSVTGTYPSVAYDWSIIDSIIAPLVAEGVNVMVSYIYLPPTLGPTLGPVSNMANWQEFNARFAEHVSTTHGVTHFEIWNEPDYGVFWSGSWSQYLETYRYAALGIRSTVPAARVGGPALAATSGSEARSFLAFVRDNSLPFDFFTYHAQNSGYSDSGSYRSQYNRIVSELDSHGFGGVNVHLTEFSYELSPSEGSRADQSYAAAWFPCWI